MHSPMMIVKRRIGIPQFRDYEYRKTSLYFAQMAEDIKAIGMEELRELGAADFQAGYQGVHFTADRETLYRINYMSRLVSRILAPLMSFDCPDTDTLYETAKKIRWRDFFDDRTTFAVTGNVADSAITHSHFAALRLKDAIVDDLRERTGERPNVDAWEPDLLFNLYINKDRAVISLDTSGQPLHKRGYREESVTAPMQETVAAAVIRYAEWDGSVPLHDPMCGSGTLLCEALMRFCRIPAGIFRKTFGFELLPDFDPDLWHQVRKTADAGIRPLSTGLISGNDISQQAVSAARTNLMGLHFGRNVAVDRLDFSDLPAMPPGVIVANPPYGVRMGKDRNLGLFYKALGDFLKQKCQGSTAYIYFGERAFVKKLGLKSTWKKPLAAGGLDGRLVKYDIY